MPVHDKNTHVFDKMRHKSSRKFCMIDKWLGNQAKLSHRELLRVAIDNALSQSPANFEELLKLLQESGCEISKRGKRIV